MRKLDSKLLTMPERKFELVYMGLCVKINEEHHVADFYCREARNELKNLDEKGNYDGKYYSGLLRRVGFVSIDFFNKHNLRSQGNLAPEFRIFGNDDGGEDLYTKVKNEMFTLDSQEFLSLGKPLALSQKVIYSPTETGGNYA